MLLRSQGGTYQEEVTIIFNEGEARLNGQLVRADFWVDQFDGSNNYRIRVREDGDYTLEVTDEAGNRTTVSFTIQSPDSVVRGVTDNGVYNSARTITFTDATATLNGEPFQSGQTVSRNGEYTLTVTGTNGKVTIIRFVIQSGDDFVGVSHWAQDDVRYARGIGLTDPVAHLNFSSLITREKFAEMALKLYEALTGTKAVVSNDNPFTDTNNADIVAAYHLGIVAGTSATVFSPDALITREQLAAMLKRVLDVTDVSIPYGSSKNFADAAQFSSYAVEAIDYLSSIDVIQGVSATEFGSKRNATIEQAIAMAKRIHALSNVGINNEANEKVSVEVGEQVPDNGLFGNGDMFVMYVKEVVTYLGVDEPRNIYALKNERSFTLPAYSAIYVLAPNYDQIPNTDNYFGFMVIANTTDQPKVVAAGSIDFSLSQIYSDHWGTVTSPDGKTEVMRSRGLYIRLAVLDGPFDETIPLYELDKLERIVDPGSWFTVRHSK